MLSAGQVLQRQSKNALHVFEPITRLGLADSDNDQVIRHGQSVQQTPEHWTDVPSLAGDQGAALLRLDDTTLDESLRRAVIRPRDLHYYGDAEAIVSRYEARFHPDQKIHLRDDRPQLTSHVIVQSH
ncbi:hypothetical protein [Williamsia sp.]|uniref:hypothetical protein n=1 Tax=Williamsia sp. TaxID=1872085 RepID=UPI002F932D0A